MKKHFILKTVIGTMLALSFIKCENVCFGTEKESISMLNKRVSQIEALWKRGNSREYYLKAAELAKDIMMNSATNNLNAISAKLLNNLISKETKIEEIDLEDLLVMQKLASYLIFNTNVSVEERRTNAKLLCRYLGKIRKEIVPNYEPKPVVANVPPPIGTPCAVSGMSPEAITDPVLRAQYEASIRKNQDNSLMNSRQAELRNIEKETLKPIMNYIIGTFHADDISSAFFTECIKYANFNDREKEEIVNRIR